MCFVDIDLTKDAKTIDTWLSIVFESLFRLTNFTKLSRFSSSPGIIRIVSICEKEIFPLMKWDRILDLTEVFLFILVPSPIASRVYTIPLGATSTGILLLGTRM